LFFIPGDDEQIEDEVSSESEEQTIQKCAEFPEDWEQLSASKKRVLLTDLTQFTTDKWIL